MLKNSILERLNSHYQEEKKPLNLGVYYKNTLVALCHALEDYILEYEGQPIIISAFQQGKWYLAEANRYGDLANKSDSIVILAATETGFKEHPTSQRANVSIVSLEESDPVAQEWHLMILSPNYSAMVLCQELSDEDYGKQGKPIQDMERKFYGFWTFEPELVIKTMYLTANHLEKMNPELAKSIEQKIRGVETNQESGNNDISSVVSKVLTYLENSQQDLLIKPVDEKGNIFSKALDNNLSSNKVQAFLRMAQIIDQTNPDNNQATTEVASLAEAMGQLLDLPGWQVKRLRLGGLLHRLPALQIFSTGEKGKNLVQKSVSKQAEYLPKSSVLRIMPQLEAIAKIITYTSEHWDGSGGPEGLSYDNIPLESRILAVVVDFQKYLNKYRHQKVDNSPSRALQDCQEQVGIIYDPKLIQALELLVLGMLQGMSLPEFQPKIASGMWLLEENEQSVKKELV